MNKYDFRLILIVLILSILLLLFFKTRSNNYAYVYYDGNEVLKIDLNIDKKYTVEGHNGEVILEVKENKLRVEKENSPLHICSKQGFTNTGSIVCLPNKIVIEFKSSELDTTIG